MRGSQQRDDGLMVDMIGEKREAGDDRGKGIARETRGKGASETEALDRLTGSGTELDLVPRVFANTA